MFSFGLAGCFISMILYIIFGQVTVKRLRKNSETKNILGVEYASGWDIINVAQALSIPRSWRRKLETSSLSSLYANSEILYKHTTKIDRVLAAIFYWLLTLSGTIMILLVIFDALSLFD
ncbi:hypothetical protein SG35_015490 [Thalassomonas actiniarum]|uniref:Uncharacterized protein n=2 Tax=Thalassomonas actiniarum TaxID=485447 RepID=A0AAE9YYE4_9GAMM|nr:hypothetical protein SG35_015490 [Thalassomonas actiniarum]